MSAYGQKLWYVKIFQCSKLIDSIPVFLTKKTTNYQKVEKFLVLSFFSTYCVYNIQTIYQPNTHDKSLKIFTIQMLWCISTFSRFHIVCYSAPTRIPWTWSVLRHSRSFWKNSWCSWNWWYSLFLRCLSICSWWASTTWVGWHLQNNPLNVS